MKQIKSLKKQIKPPKNDKFKSSFDHEQNVESESEAQDQEREPIEIAISEFLKLHLKERRISLRDLSTMLDPPLSHSALAQMLSGKTQLSLQKLSQICRALRIDINEALDAAAQRSAPKFYSYTDAQEKIICASLLHYKLFVASIRPQTTEELHELFCEFNFEEIGSALSELCEAKVLNKNHQNQYSCHEGQESNLYLPPNSPSYRKLLMSLMNELHQTNIDFTTLYRGLKPYVRSALMVEFLTPEQIRTLKHDLVAIRNKVQAFDRLNRADALNRKSSQKNLIAIASYVAPLNKSSFIRNPELGD